MRYKWIFIFLAVTLCAGLLFQWSFPHSMNSASTGLDVRPLNEFEIYVNKLGGKVPFPYIKFVSRILEDFPTGFDRLNSSLFGVIPIGRSLVKGKADFNSPRLITAFANYTREVKFHDRKGDPFLKVKQGIPATFIGYAPRSNSLEVITWNKTLGKYDFLLVDDYRAGGKPRIHRPDQQLCFACHQHGGPIFSRQTWSEAALFNEKFQGKLKIPKEFHSIRFEQGVVMDFLIRDSNDILQARRICRDACGQDPTCRLQMLHAAFRRGALEHKGPLRDQFKEILQKATSKYWPSDNFSFRSDVLPDRDPLILPEHGGEVTRIKIADINAFLKGRSDSIDTLLKTYQLAKEYTAGVELTYSRGANSFGKSDKNIPGVMVTQFPFDDLRSQGQASFLRPFVGGIPNDFAGEYIIDRLTDCFVLTDEDEAFLNAQSDEKLEEVITSPLTQRFVMAQWPPTPERTMQFIQATLAGREIPQSFFYLPKSQVVDEEQATTTSATHSPVFGHEPMAIYNFYCAKCHNANGIDLEIKSERDFLSYKDSLGESLIDKIKKNSMPQDFRKFDAVKARWWAEDKKLFLEQLGSP